MIWIDLFVFFLIVQDGVCSVLTDIRLKGSAVESESIFL